MSQFSSSVLFEFFGLFSKIKGGRLRLIQITPEVLSSLPFVKVFLKEIHSLYTWFIIADAENVHGFLGYQPQINKNEQYEIAIVLQEYSSKEIKRYVPVFLDYIYDDRLKLKTKIKFSARFIETPAMHGYCLPKKFFLSVKPMVFDYA